MCLCKEMQKEKVHQTTITQISQSSVQHFLSSGIKAAILHTSTLQKECKYTLTSFSSSKALICAEAGQSSPNHKIFRILLSSLCDAWPSRQMFLHVSTVLPQDRMIHFHTVLSSLPISLTPEGAANIYAFLSATPLCVERVFLLSFLPRLKYRRAKETWSCYFWVLTLWQGKSCFPASFLRTKLSSFTKERDLCSASSGSLQGEKLTTDILIPNQHKIIWLEIFFRSKARIHFYSSRVPSSRRGCELNPSPSGCNGVSTALDPSHHCISSLPWDKQHTLWEGMCIISAGIPPECIYPRELNHRGKGNNISHLEESNFSFNVSLNGIFLSF